MAESGGDYLGLIGLLGAAALSSAGAIYNNHQQQKLTRSINSMSKDLADSAHQREVLDLYKAGLNPILSATGNGASVPSLGTPHLDNVMSDFGSSARAIGDMMSKQRSLNNEAVKLGNDATRISNRIASGTVDSEINSANAENDALRAEAEYRNTIARDKAAQLLDWRGGTFIDGKYKTLNPDYLDEIKDSVKAEVKEPGTRYLQSWIHTGGKAAGDVINGATGVKNLMRKQPKGVYNRRIDHRGRVSTSWTEYK